MRLVNLTESILPKIGLNMTKTDQPYLFEHDRNMTMMNVNLLNSTENDWIWPKIENIINITRMTKINDWIWLKIVKFFSHVQEIDNCRCQFLVKFKDFGLIHSVIFIRSYCFDQVNNPQTCVKILYFKFDIQPWGDP